MITAFTATPTPEGERLTLARQSPAKLLRPARADVLPFEQWPADVPAPARTAFARLCALIEDGVATAEDAAVLLPAAAVAALGEAEARALGLPPATALQLDLRAIGLITRPDFRIEARWVRAGGVPVRVDTAAPSRLRHDGTDHRLPEPLFSVQAAVARVNAAPDDAARQAELATLRALIGADGEGRIAADGQIERLRIAYAAGFSLALHPDPRGIDFDPVLFTREPLAAAQAEEAAVDEVADALLPPALAQDFAQRFRASDGRRRGWLLADGTLLFVDPALAPALGVVRQAQAGGAAARQAFASNPRRAILEALGHADAADAAAALFIETQQFSERVSGVDLWRKPVLPWIKLKPNSWLPESFGLRIGDPPEETMVTIAPERADEAAAQIRAAIEAGLPSVTIDGQTIPATEQSAAALESLAALAAAAAAPEAEDAGAAPPPMEVAQRYFLQVRDNLEAVEYAPLEAPAAPALPPPAFPPSVRSTPKPHQIAGFNWLTACWRSGLPGALLADDMGLGKTFQALAFLAWLRAEGERAPVLIVAPTGLLANWASEIERHLAAEALGPVCDAHGRGLARLREGGGRDIETGRASVDPAAWSEAGIVLTTYETMRDFHLSFARQRFAAILYDEAQKLKNPASQMTRAAKTLNARFQLAMTGTPVENRLQDLWSIYDVVHPGLLGASKAFESDYPASDIARLRELHTLLTSGDAARPAHLLRRMKDECLDALPEKKIIPLKLVMPPRQAAAYSAAVARVLSAQGSGERGRMLQTLHRLRGISLHPDDPAQAADYAFEQGARLRLLFEKLEEIAAKREKVLIFCETLAMQALLAAEIRHRFHLPHPVPRIHGGVSGAQRQAEVEAFQRRGPGFDAMILSPKAGGVGLTLTAANHVIHLSRWWNPAVEDQATDRAYRIGQEKPVFVYLPMAVHPDPAVREVSFDLKLHALMERKRMLSKGLLLPGEDESDTDALFGAVVVEAVADAKADAPPEPAPAPEPPAPERARPAGTLRVPGQPPATPPAPPAPAPAAPSTAPPAAPAGIAPRRIVLQPGDPRDLRIFTLPLNGARVTRLAIRDPYACAGPAARRALIEFMRALSSAATIDQVALTCFDGDVDLAGGWETTEQQRDDLAYRWRQAFASGPRLHHQQLSRRQHRSFHDREITADIADGRQLLWDVSRGISGVMEQRHECRVVLCEAMWRPDKGG